MKTLLFVVFFVFIFPHQFFSQCCAGCSPIGGNTNQGTLRKNALQINSYYKYSYSEGYMQEDHASYFNFVQNADYRYVGLTLGYGLTKRLTFQADGGYYLNRTQNFTLLGKNFELTGYGLSSITLSGKYNLVKDSTHDLEFTLGAGVRVPSSTQPQIVNGVELSEDVQPCNGAYGMVIQSFLYKEFDESAFRIFMINAVNISGSNPRSYKEGNTYLNSLFLSKTFLKTLTGIIQIRNEIRSHSYRDNMKVMSSGGYRFILVPQLNYQIKNKYNLSFLYEFPFYQYYYGIQLKDRYAFSINLNILLGLGKKTSELCEKPQ